MIPAARLSNQFQSAQLNERRDARCTRIESSQKEREGTSALDRAMAAAKPTPAKCVKCHLSHAELARRVGTLMIEPQPDWSRHDLAA